LPWQGASVPFFTDSYAVRSYYITGFGMVTPGWTKTPESIAAVRKGYAECRRIAPLMGLRPQIDGAKVGLLNASTEPAIAE
jgi:hypothetical protein